MPEIDFPTILQSNCIFCKKTELNGTTVSVLLNWTGGNVRFFFGLSTLPTTAPVTWEEVTSLTAGVSKSYTLSGTGQALYYRIIKDTDVIISTQFNSLGQRTAPAIQIGGLV